MPELTLFYAGLLGLLMAVLSIRVPIRRAVLNAPWGDAGDQTLATRIRVFGNFIEYVPFILLMLALNEVSHLSALYIHSAGLSLLVVRIVHAVSLRANDANLARKIGRGVGAMGTWILLLALSARAVWVTIPN